MGVNKVTSRADNVKKVMRAISLAPTVKVGYPDETTGKQVHEDSGVTLAQLAMFHELGTENMPPRKFMSQGAEIFERRSGLLTPHAIRFIEGRSSGRAFGTTLGKIFVGSIEAAIHRGDFPPLAESTVQAKGSDEILIDTHELIEGLDYVVK